jgi:hypothetical protein
MSDIFPPVAQRPRLLEFAIALGSRAEALRRDECGDWRIQGKSGHIYATPGGVQIVYSSAEESPKAWTYARKALCAFASLSQDGEFDGALFLDRAPAEAEAAVIRDKLGIPKKRELSEDTLAAFQEAGVASQYRRQGRPF